MLFIDLENLIHSGTKRFHVHTMQCLLVLSILIGWPTIQAAVHVAIGGSTVFSVAPSIAVLVCELECHLRADSTKLVQESLNHLEIGAKLNDLIYLVDFSAREEIQIGVDHEAQYIITCLALHLSPTIDATLHTLVQHHLLGKLHCLLQLRKFNNDTSSMTEKREQNLVQHLFC